MSQTLMPLPAATKPPFSFRDIPAKLRPNVPAAAAKPEARSEPLAWPRCAACDRSVTRMSWSASRGAEEMVFTVECHGVSQEVMLPLATALRGDVPAAVFACHID